MAIAWSLAAAEEEIRHSLGIGSKDRLFDSLDGRQGKERMQRSYALCSILSVVLVVALLAEPCL